MSGTDPEVGPSGSSRLQDAEVDEGRRRCRVRALLTNRELLDWVSDARELVRVSARPPIVEPANVVFAGRVMQPYRLSFPPDYLHVTENLNEPFLLAEPPVGLDIGSLLDPAVEDVVARGRLGLIKVGPSPEAECRT